MSQTLYDRDGRLVFQGSSSGFGGSLPDPITTDVTIAPTLGTGGNALEVKGEDGRLLLIVGDSQGAVDVRLRTDFGDTFGVSLEDAGGAEGASLIKARSDVGLNGGIGFFNAAPVGQPAAPTTLADVIAALKALGLVAT